jgi:DUF4097 and DUF4098 domain-containing protein YvlB
MKKLLVVLSALTLLPLAVPNLEAGQNETERVSRTLPLSPGGSLRLKSFSGRVNITGTDGNEVVVDAVRRGTRDRLDHVKLDIRSDASGVSIEANSRDSSWRFHDNVVETDFDIKVPRKTNLDVKVFSAAVNVDGVDGRHNVGGFSSRITLLNVTGPVKAHTFSGAVEIHAREWQPRQEIDVDTFSGNVTLRVPETAAAMVSFNSFSGYLNSELPLTFRNGRKTNLTAELGANPGNGGNVRFKTFSGTVRIDR